MLHFKRLGINYLRQFYTVITRGAPDLEFCYPVGSGQSQRKDPPHSPVGGGASRMLRGLMLRRRAVLGTPKCEKSVGRRGSAPDPAGGAYSAPPDP